MSGIGVEEVVNETEVLEIPMEPLSLAVLLMVWLLRMNFWELMMAAL